MSESERIAKYLASAGVASRRVTRLIEIAEDELAFAEESAVPLSDRDRKDRKSVV